MNDGGVIHWLNPLKKLDVLRHLFIYDECDCPCHDRLHALCKEIYVCLNLIRKRRRDIRDPLRFLIDGIRAIYIDDVNKKIEERCGCPSRYSSFHK